MDRAIAGQVDVVAAVLADESHGILRCAADAALDKNSRGRESTGDRQPCR